jgi:hypothetical protein
MRAGSKSGKDKKQISPYSHSKEIDLLVPNKSYCELVSPRNIRGQICVALRIKISSFFNIAIMNRLRMKKIPSTIDLKNPGMNLTKKIYL